MGPYSPFPTERHRGQAPFPPTIVLETRGGSNRINPRGLQGGAQSEQRGQQEIPILTLTGISKRFGATIALDGVDLEFAPGQVYALIGENGAGKSTLMNIISGAVKPDAGLMELDGKPYHPASPAGARDNGISLIHQELSLFPHLSVAENIMMGIEPARMGLMDFE